MHVPRKGLVGPWSHKYPHLGQPGPAVGFLQELVWWWDLWLRDVDNDAMDEPMLRIWMQESVRPSTAYEDRPGRWVGEPSWRAPHVRQATHPRSPSNPARRGRRADLRGSRPELAVALVGGPVRREVVLLQRAPDLPYDQREEDGGSLTFDGDVLTERMEILGTPIVHLKLAADQPVEMIALRLSDVAPDGRATRISYGLLNLTHRAGHHRPEALTPGERYRVSVTLNAMAQALPQGHRLRLALSTSYWPLAWPPPWPVRLSVYPARSALVLPLRPDPGVDELPVPSLGEPEVAQPLQTRQIEPARHRWTVTRDLDVTRRAAERYSWVADDVTSVRGEIRWSMGFASGEWKIRTETHTVLIATEADFRLHAPLDAHEGDERVFERSWRLTGPPRQRLKMVGKGRLYRPSARAPRMKRRLRVSKVPSRTSL